MKKSSTVVTIPLYPGVRGSLIEAPWTQRGDALTQKIYWVVPMGLSWPDGWGIFNLKLVPSLAAYTGIVEFKLWDVYQLAQPKYMGCIKIDSADDSYVVELEQAYHKYRLTAAFTITHHPREPNEALAFRNGTPYGEWQYKDQI